MRIMCDIVVVLMFADMSVENLNIELLRIRSEVSMPLIERTNDCVLIISRSRGRERKYPEVSLRRFAQQLSG